MEEKFAPKDCNDNDVISFGNATYKIGSFKRALNKSFGDHLGGQLNHQLSQNGIRIPDAILRPPGISQSGARWFGNGIDCEILNLGSEQWKKGKVRVKFSVEFYVESEETEEISNNNNSEYIEPESPLDDLRKKFNQEN